MARCHHSRNTSTSDAAQDEFSAGSPSDKERVAEYEAGPYKGFADDIIKDFASIVPPEADVSAVAEAIVRGWILSLEKDHSECTWIPRRTALRLALVVCANRWQGRFFGLRNFLQ
jgi:hypothetical protein